MLRNLVWFSAVRADIVDMRSTPDSTGMISHIANISCFVKAPCMLTMITVVL